MKDSSKVLFPKPQQWLDIHSIVFPTAYVPLCENMVGGMSVKPGDAVQGLNGKTVIIEDTHLEGRAIMMDPISYSGVVHPCLLTTVATLTGKEVYSYLGWEKSLTQKSYTHRRRGKCDTLVIIPSYRDRIKN